MAYILYKTGCPYGKGGQVPGTDLVLLEHKYGGESVRVVTSIKTQSLLF